MRINNFRDVEYAINQAMKKIEELNRKIMFSNSNISQLGNQTTIGGDTVFQGRTETKLPNIMALSSGSVPTDSDATGAFVAEPGYEFDGKTYNVGNVKDGVLGAGFTDDGGITATEGTIGGSVIGSDTLESANYVEDTSGYKLTGSTGRIEGNNAKIGAWEADNVKFESENYVAGQAGASLNGVTGDIEVQNIKARGAIVASVFETGQVTATSGTQGWYKSAGKLKADATTVASPTTFTIDIDDPESGHAALFVVNDILRLKDSRLDDWLKVGTVTDMTTYYRYTCTLESGTAGTFTAGAIVVNYGQAGDGFLIATADDTNAPFFAVYTHAGEPWTAISEVARLGNLNGALDYVSDKYGIAIGSDSGYLKYDPDGGFVIGFAGGDATIGADGIVIDRMGYLLAHTATDGTTERTGSLGMWAEPGGTAPQYGIAFNAPAGVDLILNGDFTYTELLTDSFVQGVDVNDIVGWTEVLGAGGSITLNPYPFVEIIEGANAKTTYIEKTITLELGKRYKFQYSRIGYPGWGTGYAEILDASDDSVIDSTTGAAKYYTALVTSVKVRLYAGTLASAKVGYTWAKFGEHFSGWTLNDISAWYMTFSRASCSATPATMSKTVSVTELTNYLLSLYSSGATSTTYQLAKLYWYDTGSALLQTDTITLTSGTNTRLATSPLGATSVKVELVGRTSYSMDTVTFASVSVASNLYFDSTGELKLNDDPLLPEILQVPGMWTSTATLTLNVVQHAYTCVAANASNGNVHTLKIPPLAKGTYTVLFNGGRGPERCKVDWTLDGVSIATGQDWYASSPGEYFFTVTGVTVGTTGTHTLVGTINGKNASSSDYEFFVYNIYFIKTA